jgi:hypothetical protein
MTKSCEPSPGRQGSGDVGLQVATELQPSPRKVRPGDTGAVARPRVMTLVLPLRRRQGLSGVGSSPQQRRLFVLQSIVGSRPRGNDN